MIYHSVNEWLTTKSLKILSQILYTFCDNRIGFRLSKHQPVQPLSGSMVGIGNDMAVAVHGGLNRGVAQLALDELDVFVWKASFPRCASWHSVGHGG